MRRSYELLADALGTSREAMYRRFWPSEPGTIRDSFTDVIDDLYHEDKGRRLTLQERRDALDLADELFASSRQHVFNRAIERRIERDWRGRLP